MAAIQLPTTRTAMRVQSQRSQITNADTNATSTKMTTRIPSNSRVPPAGPAGEAAAVEKPMNGAQQGRDSCDNSRRQAKVGRDEHAEHHE